MNNLPQDAGTSSIEAVVAALHLASTDEEVEVPDGWWAGSLRLMMMKMMKLVAENPLNDALVMLTVVKVRVMPERHDVIRYN